jgi:transposase
MGGGHVRDSPQVRSRVREGAVRIVRETGKPVAQVARDLGINEGTLGNWCAQDRAAQPAGGAISAGQAEELTRLRSEVAELRMERDVLIGASEIGSGWVAVDVW